MGSQKNSREVKGKPTLSLCGAAFLGGTSGSTGCSSNATPHTYLVLALQSMLLLLLGEGCKLKYRRCRNCLRQSFYSRFYFLATQFSFACYHGLTLLLSSWLQSLHYSAPLRSKSQRCPSYECCAQVSLRLLYRRVQCILYTAIILVFAKCSVTHYGVR